MASVVYQSLIAGTSCRFEPGESKAVPLIPIAGARIIRGRAMSRALSEIAHNLLQHVRQPLLSYCNQLYATRLTYLSSLCWSLLCGGNNIVDGPADGPEALAKAMKNVAEGEFLHVKAIGAPTPVGLA
jgi:hypothetical protein